MCWVFTYRVERRAVDSGLDDLNRRIVTDVGLVPRREWHLGQAHGARVICVCRAGQLEDRVHDSKIHTNDRLSFLLA